jgi:hypothetical protein
MRRRQRVAHLDCNLQSASDLERAPFDQLADVAAFDELHHDEDSAVNLHQVMHRADVRMVQ